MQTETLWHRGKAAVSLPTCILALLAIAASADAGGTPPTTPGPVPAWLSEMNGTGIELKLIEKDRLKRTRLVFGEGEGILGLTGILVVEVTNTTDSELVIEDLSVHNLVFVDVKEGRDFVMIHPCDCVGYCQGMQEVRKRVVLKPKQTHLVVLDDFGCSGSMWKPPEEGVYDLYYRVRAYGEGEMGIACQNEENVTNSLDSCRSSLLSPSFWKGGFVSKPARIDLRKTGIKKLK